jgi:hypothetical protein
MTSENQHPCQNDIRSNNDDLGIPAHAMNFYFSQAHAYQVPPTVQHAKYPFRVPPRLFPYDVYIHRYLSMWIMPTNHITHAIFFGTILCYISTRWWIPIVLRMYEEGTKNEYGRLWFKCATFHCSEEYYGLSNDMESILYRDGFYDNYNGGGLEKSISEI